MITLFLFCISVTWLLTQHRDAQMFQAWVFYKAYEKGTKEDLTEYWKVKNIWWHELYHLATCPYCVGFWSGIIVFYIFNPNLFIVYAFINALLSLAVCQVLSFTKR